MKNKTLQILVLALIATALLASLASAADYIVDAEGTYGSTSAEGNAVGWNVTITSGNITGVNLTAINFTRPSGSAATLCLYYAGNGTHLGNASFIGDQCIINVTTPTQLVLGRSYAFVLSGGGASVNQRYSGSASFPYVDGVGTVVSSAERNSGGAITTRTDLAWGIQRINFMTSTNIPNITFYPTTPLNSTALYQPTNSNFTINTSVNYFSGNVNTTHYLYNSSFSLISQINGTSNFNLTTNYTGLSSGTYYYNATAFNGTTMLSTETRTLYFYTVVSGSIVNLSNGSATNLQTVNFAWTNGTVNPPASGVTLRNFTLELYNNDSVTFNRTIGSTSQLNITGYNIASQSLRTGKYWLKLTSQDSQGNTVSSTSYFDYINPNFNYTTPAIEGENYEFNITMPTGSLNFTVTAFNATLQYNNVNYTATSIISASSVYAYYNITLPDITSSTTNAFYWFYTINGVLYNSTQFNQTVLVLTPINVTGGSCTTGLTAAMLFTLKDEETLTNLNGSITYNFQFGLTNGSFGTSYGTINNSQTFSLCINATLNPNWTIGTGQIMYTSPNYVERTYYVFSNTRVSSNTINVTLFNLLSTQSTSFQITVQTQIAQDPYVSKYVGLIRWYPASNSYSVVDMGLTDNNGQTLIHSVVEDVDYRFGIYHQNGSLISLKDPIRMVCLTSPCTYTITIADETTDYDNLLKLQYSLTYNETSGNWLLEYNDPSQETSQINLTIYRMTGSAQIKLCNNYLNSYTGAINCTIPVYAEATLKAVVSRSASPEVPIYQQIITLSNSQFASSWGLFLSFILLVPITFALAVLGPAMAVIGAIIAVIASFFLGSITFAIVSGFTILAAITLHFMNKSQGR